MDFYHSTGSAALGSRLRRLSDRFTADAATVFGAYSVPIDPRAFPLVYALAHEGAMSVGQLARHLGVTHAWVSQVAKQLVADDILTVERGDADARVSVLSLSARGRAVMPTLETQVRDVRVAVDDLLGDMQHNLLRAIEEAERLLDQAGFAERVQRVRNARAPRDVQIVDYTPAFQADFRRLNVAWIERYFVLEPADLEALDHPDEKILARGGQILLAQVDGRIVGTCALLPMDAGTVELAKMAVDESMQGRGIG
ncbi:MAG: bifunctional helix-turn-helix transcriptional regulator/GNAT family N-acetyltransferase, partial [Gemmatimonadaceae bacterium]|nr:bifunctional helix-turn-helix transcriptional regulator/GNAT family N-acetyltransferase [Gemmatimonadaceae bacterium]